MVFIRLLNLTFRQGLSTTTVPVLDTDSGSQRFKS